MTGWIDTVLTDEQARDLPCPNTYCNTYKTNYTCKACIQAKATWEARDAEIDALQIKFLEFQKASMNILLETCEKLNSQKEVAYKAGQKSGRQEVVDWVEAIGNCGHLFRVARWSWEIMKEKWGIE
jgi:hypothetical protein